jgi:hypothetical protein
MKIGEQPMNEKVDSGTQKNSIMLVNLLELCTISKHTDRKIIKYIMTWPKINWTCVQVNNKNEKDMSCFQIDVLLCTTSDTSNGMIDLTSNISWNSLSTKKQIAVLPKLKTLERLNWKNILMIKHDTRILWNTTLQGLP